MSADLSQMRDPLGLLRLGYAAPLLDVRARHWHDGESEERDERVAEETPVAIVYNSVPHVVMMCTPIDLEDFALGFSITEEFIRTPDDMRSIQVVRYSQGIEIQTEVSPECEATIASRDRRLTGRTGCGICGADTIAAVLKTLHPVTSRVPVSGAAIARAMREMCERQPLNAAAGAVHAAGWADADGTVALVREDVGRHNALDKLIGAMLAARMDASAGFAVVTSRASFEMVQKATVLGAPLLAAISGPTGLAVRVAQQAGLTLVGFARGGKLTVYTHPDRVIA